MGTSQLFRFGECVDFYQICENLNLTQKTHKRGWGLGGFIAQKDTKD